MPPQYERRSPAPPWEFDLSAVFNWLFNGSKDEEAKARAAPNGSASEGVQNTHPTISRENNPGTASVPSFGLTSLQQIFGGNSSQPPSMGSFPAGGLGWSSGLLDVNDATRRVDDSLRRIKRETRMNEPPFPYLSDPFEGVQSTHPTISRGSNPGTASVPSFGLGSLQQIFGGNSSQPPSMGSFPAGGLGWSSGLLDVNDATRRVDDSLRRIKRETRMNEPPFPYLSDPFDKLFK